MLSISWHVRLKMTFPKGKSGAHTHGTTKGIRSSNTAAVPTLEDVATLELLLLMGIVLATDWKNWERNL